MRKNSFLIVLILPFLTGCFSAVPVAQLEPVDDKVQWNYGQQRVYKTHDSITVGMAFTRSTDHYIIFDMIFTNHSDRDILIAPESFYYRCKNKYGTLLGTKLYTVNPEEKLLQIDKRISKTNAQQANQAILSLISTTVETTATIASLEASADSRTQLADDIQRNRYHRAQSRNDMKAGLWSLNKQRAFWSDAVLRKTTLAPGFYVEGKVYFERNECAATCLFSVPVNGTSFDYSFEQSLVKP